MAGTFWDIAADAGAGKVTTGPSVIVFEQQPRWLPELQRQFLGSPVRVRLCPRLARMPELLAERPGSVVVLALEAAPAECLQFLGRRAGHADGPVIVVATKPLMELEWVVRELGAVAFRIEPIPGDEMADLCRRQFRAASPI